MKDERLKTIKNRVNNELAINYDTKLNLSKVRELEGNKFELFVSYNRIFNVIDETNKIVYVRNIHFKDIYNTVLHFEDNIKLPIHEINSSIRDEFMELRDNLFSKVLERKDIVVKILKNIHVTSAWLNRFYTIFNDLVYSDVISSEYVQEYLRHSSKNQKYFDLIIDSGLAKMQENGSLKASNKFKKLLENNKGNPSAAVEEAVYYLVKANYDYILYELGLRHIKPYVNIVACVYYLNEVQNLGKINLSIDNLHKIYCDIFDRISKISFREKVNSLIVSNVFSRSDNSIKLAVT